MQLADTLRSIFRRWYIVVLGLAITSGLAGAALLLIQPTYEAEGSLLLMPPSEVVGTDGNPYLYLGGMNEALDVLVRRANAPEAVEAVEKQFSGVAISYQSNSTTSSPIVVLNITGPVEADVLRALEAGRMTIVRNLDSMQRELNVPQNMQITIEDLVIAHEADPNRKMAIQFAILVAAAGIVGTLMLTGLVDGQLLARAKAKGSDRRQNSRPRSSQHPELLEPFTHPEADPSPAASPPLRSTLGPNRSMAESLNQ